METGELLSAFLDAGACRRMLDRGVRTFCIDAINIDDMTPELAPWVATA